jgi:hypothetical protein
MAFSICGLAAMVGSAPAQQPTVRPWPGSTISAPTTWPMPATAPNPAPATPSPFTGAPSGTTEPAAPASGMTGQVAAGAQPIRTLHYRKDASAGVKQPPAADLALPRPGGVIQAQHTAEPAPPPRRLEPTIPSNQELFRLDSEDGFIAHQNAERKRRREDPALTKDEKEDKLGELRPIDAFPKHTELTTEKYRPRAFQPSQGLLEPNFVCYRRLFYEDRNTERYGWSMGPLQPFLSTATFLGGVQYAPYKFFSFPGLRYDCNAGLPLPGDPVPMMLYPPEASVTGAIAQATVAVAGYFIIR